METRLNPSDNPWRYVQMFVKWKLSFLNVGSNLVGAGIVTSYFLYFDQIGPIPQAGTTLVVVGVLCIGLVVMGTVITSRWLTDLVRFVIHKQENNSENEIYTDSQAEKPKEFNKFLFIHSSLSWNLCSTRSEMRLTKNVMIKRTSPIANKA